MGSVPCWSACSACLIRSASATSKPSDSPSPASISGAIAGSTWSSGFSGHLGMSSDSSGPWLLSIASAGRVIRVARALDGELVLPPLGRGKRLLEAADRRAEPAPRFRQSLGAEHDQRDGEEQEQVSRAEDVLDHRGSCGSVLYSDVGAEGP